MRPEGPLVRWTLQEAWAVSSEFKGYWYKLTVQVNRFVVLTWGNKPPFVQVAQMHKGWIQYIDSSGLWALVTHVRMCRVCTWKEMLTGSASVCTRRSLHARYQAMSVPVQKIKNFKALLTIFSFYNITWQSWECWKCWRFYYSFRHQQCVYNWQNPWCRGRNFEDKLGV